MASPTHDSAQQGGSPPAVPDSAAGIGSDRRRLMLRIGAAVVAVIAVAVLAWALTTPASGSQPKPGAAPGAPAPLVGHYAPDATMPDLANHNVTLSSLRGKVVLINFWYVACEPCQYEMPALEKTYQAQASQGFTVVGVDVNDDAPTISSFIQRLGVTYPILLDVGEHATLEYKLTATPTSFLVDRQGVIRYRFVGPVDRSALSRDVATLLASK